MSGQRKKIREIARYFSCVGRSDPLRALQALKTKDVAERQAGRRPYAAAITGADTPKFRKQSYTFCNVEKLRRNSLVLQFLAISDMQFQNISHQDIDAKVDD